MFKGLRLKWTYEELITPTPSRCYFVCEWLGILNKQITPFTFCTGAFTMWLRRVYVNRKRHVFLEGKSSILKVQSRTNPIMDFQGFFSLSVNSNEKKKNLLNYLVPMVSTALLEHLLLKMLPTHRKYYSSFVFVGLFKRQ